MTPAEWSTFIGHALAQPRQRPTDHPDPRRTDHLTPGTPEWARIGNAGHRCQRCGHGCGTTDCHVQCCGTEPSWRLRLPVGSYCTGHPCPACRGTGERPDEAATYQPALFAVHT